MKHIIALHREFSMSTPASMFGPAVAMAAEAIERAPDIRMRLCRFTMAIRRETFATWRFPLLVFVGGSRAPSLIDSLNPSLAPPSTEFHCKLRFY